MKLLISSPRCGSTNYNEYFNEYNKNKYNCEVIEGFSEYLLDANHSNDIFNSTLEDRIKIIEQKRKQGIELLYKVHAFHLYQNDWIYNWYFNFYKNAEFFILKRKDLWRAYISLLCHYSIGRQLWHNDGTKDKELDLVLSKTNIKHDEKIIKSFLFQQQCLNEVKGKVLYLEDIDHNYICDKLEVNIKEKYKPWNIDYEKYI